MEKLEQKDKSRQAHRMKQNRRGTVCVCGLVLKFANECYKQNKAMDIECNVFDKLTLRERGTIMNHVVGLVLTQSLKGHFIYST